MERDPPLIKLFTGQFHWEIDSHRNLAAKEYLRGGIADLTPLPQNAVANYTYGWGSRSSTGILFVSPYYQHSWLVMRDFGPGTPKERICQFDNRSVNTSLAYLISGYPMFRPVMVYYYIGAKWKALGRLYQHYLGPSDLGTGIDIDIPIDVGVNGAFRVTVPPATSENRIQLIRVG